MLQRFITKVVNKLLFWYVDWKIVRENNKGMSQSEINEITALFDEYSKVTQETTSKIKELKVAVKENGEALERLAKAYKKPVDFHVEVNPNFMPSQEQLDAGGGEGSKRFAEVYIKALQKNK